MKSFTQSAFTDPPTFEVLNEPLVIHQREGYTQNECLAVFVHGFRGSRYGKSPTWGRFPQLLFDNLTNIDIGLYAYNFVKRFRGSTTFQDESRVLAHIIRDAEKYTTTILIGHSEGGILCQSAISYLATHESTVLSRIGGLIPKG